MWFEALCPHYPAYASRLPCPGQGLHLWALVIPTTLQSLCLCPCLVSSPDHESLKVGLCVHPCAPHPSTGPGASQVSLNGNRAGNREAAGWLLSECCWEKSLRNSALLLAGSHRGDQPPLSLVSLSQFGPPCHLTAFPFIACLESVMVLVPVRGQKLSFQPKLPLRGMWSLYWFPGAAVTN